MLPAPHSISRPTALAALFAVAILLAYVGSTWAEEEAGAEGPAVEAVQVATLSDFAPDFDDIPPPAELAPEDPAEQAPPLEAVEPTPPPTSDALASPPFRFESPFSLTDCVTILRAVIAGLPMEEGVVFPRYEVMTLRRAIEVVTNYLKARDDLHYNLVDYRWERVGTDSATSALIQPLRFIWDAAAMPMRVDAFSLEVLRGDAFLHSMMVYDDEGELVADYKFDATRVMRLRHSLPRREVFHLWRPTSVSRVELAVSRFDPQAPDYPQVQLHAGRTARPEHGKATIYFLTRAERDLAGERLVEARQNLQHALGEMIAYNQLLRERR